MYKDLYEYIWFIYIEQEQLKPFTNFIFDNQNILSVIFKYLKFKDILSLRSVNKKGRISVDKYLFQLYVRMDMKLFEQYLEILLKGANKVIIQVLDSDYKITIVNDISSHSSIKIPQKCTRWNSEIRGTILYFETKKLLCIFVKMFKKFDDIISKLLGD